MTQESRTKSLVCSVPKLIKSDAPQSHCPGCHYGTIYRVIAESLDELGLGGRAVIVVGIGCSTRATRLFDVDMVISPHGRPPAVATGIKRLVPDATVLTMQGDGDLLAIGAGQFVNTMMRAEKITTVFLNNAGYGMTGGQMAPTTPTGMRTTTTTSGRDPSHLGFPVHAVEMAAGMQGTAYAARCSVHTPANQRRAKKAMKTALRKQVDGVGYGIVEFLSACPVNWAMSVNDCLTFMDSCLIKEFPLGEFKNVESIDYSYDPQMTAVGMASR
jgi:2-oxoglutarate ferredoxin oxidoreductase subunit beta